MGMSSRWSITPILAWKGEIGRRKWPQLKLATWNIRKCVGLDRRRDPHRVAGVIAGLEADVVALQEADKRLGVRPCSLVASEIVERETDLGASRCRRP